MNERQRARTRRLRRELLDLQANPVENCSAAPVRDSLDTWHANIYSPLFEATFHFEIEFPRSYPNNAPEVRNLTYIQHKNVFSSYICLDILTMSEETQNTPFRGWTSAYTISSLLVQLQCFLFDVEKVSSGWEKRSQERMVKQANEFCCGCGHTPTKCFPVIERMNYEISWQPEEIDWEAERPDVVEEEEEESSVSEACTILDDIPDIILNCICSLLDSETLKKVQSICSRPLKAIDRVLVKQTYKCFYTLKDLNDERVVLGLGAKKDIMGRRSRKTRQLNVQLQRLHCSFDYLSLEAYKLGVRNNIWKDRDFDAFIPLYINTEHGKRAIPVAEQCLLKMWRSEELTKKETMLTPPVILNTLAKLMNTTVANMMKTVEDLECGELQLFDSIKALEGYVSFHHLLLAFVQKYPIIKDIANERVRKFIEMPSYRDKEVTPDIGELLVDLSISDYSWTDFCPFYLEECFIRNARWICSAYPALLHMNEKSSCARLRQSFDATRTGKRLSMFQRFFISEIACPERLKGCEDKNAILLREYNNRLGLPPHGMAEKLQEHSRNILACDNWFDYFTLIDFCPPCAPRLDAWLRNSVLISERKKYHNVDLIYRYSENWKAQPKDTFHLDHLNCICSGSVFRIQENKTECVIASGPKPELVKKMKTGIDICFVMDCTGSMGSWIRKAKESVRNIIERVSTECDSQVRFSCVGYRDHHGQGYNKDDKFIVKGHDFTRSVDKAKGYLDSFSAAGGRDYPEAMCPALKEAYEMAWNRDSHQIVILIADAPPHGLGCSGDDYEDGDPSGEDSFRIMHTMAKAGIVCYPVDCGHADATRQTFFHAMARITGGYALDMRDSSLLPDIVVAACREERALDTLSMKVEPILKDTMKALPRARFEQYCRSVYAQLNYDKVMIQSLLPEDKYDYSVAHQIECFEFCTDMKQAKKMQSSEYFVPITRKTKLKAGGKRPVTEAQVTKCLKRMKTKMAEEDFMQHGCAYKNADRFKTKQFNARWKEFRANSKVPAAVFNKFKPWRELTKKQLREHENIPDGRKMKKDNMKALRRKTQDLGLLTDEMIGTKIMIKLDGPWTEVTVLKRYRRAGFLVDDNGFDTVVPESVAWKPIKETVKAEKPVPGKWSGSTAKPVAKPAPEPVEVAAEPKPIGREEPKAECPFEIGTVVSMRNNTSENWRLGTVTRIAPVMVCPIGEMSSTMFSIIAPARTRDFVTNVRLTLRDMITAAPGSTDQVVEADTLIQIATFNGPLARIVSPVHGWVLAKYDGVKLIRKPGTPNPTLAPPAPVEAPAPRVIAPAPVVEPAPVVVEASVVVAPRVVEAPEPRVVVAPTRVVAPQPPVMVAPAPAPRVVAPSAPQPAAQIQIGQVVNCRNNDSERWRIGTVVQNTPVIMVYVRGDLASKAYTQLAPAATRKFVFIEENARIYNDLNGTPLEFYLQRNDPIEIIEFVGSWAHMVSPLNGWIIAKHDNGQKRIARASTAPVAVQKPPSSPASTSLMLIVNDVPVSISASRVAQICQMQGGLPLNVDMFETEGRRFARVTFDEEMKAQTIYNKGLVCNGARLNLQWSL